MGTHQMTLPMLAIIHSLFSLWSGVLSTKYVCSRAIQSSPPPRKSGFRAGVTGLLDQWFTIQKHALRFRMKKMPLDVRKWSCPEYGLSMIATLTRPVI
jgi:hypothetical protein